MWSGQLESGQAHARHSQRGLGERLSGRLGDFVFPGACFSSFIAANSFKTTMPKINPFITVGCGALVSIALAVSGWAGDVASIFALIGASFGPICGAMVADYLLGGPEMVRAPRRFQPGRLDLVVRRVRRRGIQFGRRTDARMELVDGQVPRLEGTT